MSVISVITVLLCTSTLVCWLAFEVSIVLGTGAIYMGFGYAGFRMYKVDDYGCAGYIRPIKVGISNNSLF